MSIILDTSYMVAYSDKRDKYHKEAVELSKSLFSGEWGQVLVSDYVFDETVTYVFSKQGIEKAIEVGTHLLESDIQLLNLSSELFRKAWGLFKQRKNLSFTDCSTIALMDSYGIKNIATFDSGFEQFRKEIKILH